MGKWTWRFFENEEVLWVKILQSKYGENPFNIGRNLGVGEGRGRNVGVKLSSWWKDICELFWGEGGDEGVGLRREFVRRVGKGNKTRFWVDNFSLKDKFNRLYRISLQKEVGGWEQDEWRCNFSWSRELKATDLDMLNSLYDVVNRYQFSKYDEDRWTWQHAASGIYT